MKNALCERLQLPPYTRKNNQGMGITVASTRRPLFCLWMLVVLLAKAEESVQSQTSEPGIHVSGSWSAAFPRLQEPRYENMAFDAYMAGNRYYIAMDQHLGPRRADYLVGTSDGMDSFEMWVPPSWKQPGQLQPVFQQTTNYEQANSYVRSGIFPVGQNTCVQVLWLAFAFPFQSKLTLHSSANIPFKFMGNAPEDNWVLPEDWIVKRQYWTSANGRRLKRLRIYHPGHGKMRGQPYEYAIMTPAYWNGWLKLEYECIEETNVNGATLPLTFSYKEFAAPQGRAPTNRDDVDLAFIMTGQVANLALDVPLPSEYPLIATNGHSTCGDFRILGFDSQPKFLNLRDDGGFLRRGTPRFEAALKEAKADIKRHEHAANRGGVPQRPAPASLKGAPLPHLSTVNLVKGGPLPDLSTVNLAADAVPAGKPVLLCLFDAGQRPSRHVMSQLNAQAAALRKENVSVLGVQAVVASDEVFNDWKTASPVSFPVGRVTETSAKCWWASDVGVLPWLVLVDAHHQVVAEGFGLDELDGQIQKLRRGLGHR